MTHEMTEEEIDREVERAMENPAARKVSTLNEPNTDVPTDEKKYRERLVKNGPGLMEQMLKYREEQEL